MKTTFWLAGIATAGFFFGVPLPGAERERFAREDLLRFSWPTMREETLFSRLRMRAKF